LLLESGSGGFDASSVCSPAARLLTYQFTPTTHQQACRVADQRHDAALYREQGLTDNAVVSSHLSA
jgi:hypothetical protein